MYCAGRVLSLLAYASGFPCQFAVPKTFYVFNTLIKLKYAPACLVRALQVLCVTCPSDECGFRGQLSPKQQVQQGMQLQDLPRLPHCFEGINYAFLEGSTASAPAGKIHQAAYKWVHACLVEEAWRKALQVEQQFAAEQTVWSTYCQQLVSVARASLQLVLTCLFSYSSAKAPAWCCLALLVI